MGDTLRSQTISTELQRIAEQARAYPETAFTTLVHLIDAGYLQEAFDRLNRGAAPGVDGVTMKEYTKNLEANLADLYERLRSKQYRATPVKRIWLDKADGRKRPNWTKSRRGYWVVKRKTIGKRMRRAIKGFWQWCRENMHEPIKEQYKKLSQKLRGYYQYYAIRGNYRAGLRSSWSCRGSSDRSPAPISRVVSVRDE